VILAGEWWHTPLIPALGVEASLQSEFQNYTEKPCLEKKKILATTWWLTTICNGI
jgi:hypothetical protein